MVTLGVAESFDPFVNRNADGTYAGYDIDISHEISKKTGLEIRFAIGKWEKIIKRAEERELDGISCAIPSPARKKYFNFTMPYAEYSNIVIVRKGNPEEIYSIKDLKGKRAAVMAGNINSINDVRELAVSAKIVFEPNLYNVIRSVVMGHSDFMIGGEPVHYLAAQMGLAGFLRTAFPIGTVSAFSFGLRNDRPELVSIFNKALKSIPQDVMVVIRNRWLSGAAWEPSASGGRIRLSDAEQNYLSINHSLGVGVRDDYLPFSKFTSDGDLDGMAADFIYLAGERLGSGVRLLPVKSSDPMKDLLDNKCDILVMCRECGSELPGVLLTTPYLSFPYVAVATIDKQFQMDFQPEGNQTYAVLRGSPIFSKLKERYPGLDIREVDSVNQGLKRVLSGDYFGMIGISPAVTHEIQKNFLTELKITGHTPFKAKFAVATRKSAPLLNQIFQKIVGNMPDKAKKQIVNKWMAVKYEKGVDYVLVWRIVAVAVFLLAVFFFWNRKLGVAKRRAEAALEAERKAIRANLNFIDMISHEYRSPLSVISSNLDLIEEKTIGGDAKNVSKELGRMRNSAKRLLNIFEQSLSKIRMDSAHLLPDKQDLDLEHIVKSAVRDIKNVHHSHSILLEGDGSVPLVVHADPELLHFAVINLLDNACKYSKSGDTVTVFWGVCNGKSILRVRDAGIGIGGEDIGHIFEKYYRSQNVGAKRGVGMGLYLVKNIVDLHGWEIQVASKPREGTTFIIQFPAAQPKQRIA